MYTIVLLIAVLLGLAVGLVISAFADFISSLVFDDHEPTPVHHRVVLGCAATALWLTHVQGLLLWAAVTLALWPVAVGLYCLIRYRPHWFTIWSAAKAVFAVAISPVILLIYSLDKWGFIAIMSALWPHLDIYTPDGRLYLRRWFMTPKGQRYHPRFLHLIMLPDEGRDPHDHPGAFTTTILMNGYDEEVYLPRGFWQVGPRTEDVAGRPGKPLMIYARVGHTLINYEGHTHAVKLIGPTLTWVKGWKKGRKWGFWKMHPTDPYQDEWIESEVYGEKGEERKSWTIDGK